MKRYANVAATVALPEQITFVTGNAGKVREMTEVLSPLGIAVVQDDRGYPETQADSLDAVAEAGAQALLADGLGAPFILEDAGLFVASLNGFPGVYSRYVLDTIGCQGLLRLMQDVELESRTAAFRAHLGYVDAAGAFQGFTGTVKGRIADRAAGDGGFGFDPVFIPAGHERTFAQMDDAEKTSMSHRGAAARAFAAYLSNQ